MAYATQFLTCSIRPPFRRKEVTLSNIVPIPAAQYLRMSTEDQQYSIVNQRIRIQEYAQSQGFAVIKTYEDPGKSGVIIKHRKGLP